LSDEIRGNYQEKKFAHDLLTPCSTQSKVEGAKPSLSPENFYSFNRFFAFELTLFPSGQQKNNSKRTLFEHDMKSNKKTR